MVERSLEEPRVVGSNPTPSTMKICPKCKIKHNKLGTFCSRKCANSRIWTKKDKIKKSISAKNSIKVKIANADPKKRTLLSKLAKKQNKEGKTQWEQLHCRKVWNKISKSLKARYKKQRENLDQTIYNNYKQLCQFRFNLSDYQNEFNFNLIQKYGWYSATNKGNNLKGVSRDHKYSINEGFKNKIDPYYISHPANCELLQHNKNFLKNSKCSITIEKLIKKIEYWNKKYKRADGDNG